MWHIKEVITFLDYILKLDEYFPNRKYTHVLLETMETFVLSLLGVKIRNLIVDFKTEGTWRQVGQ